MKKQKQKKRLPQDIEGKVEVLKFTVDGKDQTKEFIEAKGGSREVKFSVHDSGIILAALEDKVKTAAEKMLKGLVAGKGNSES